MLFAPAVQPPPLSPRETTLISAGAAILGGLVGGLVPVISLLVRDWWRRPRLRLDFEGTADGNLIDVDFTKDGNHIARVYVRPRLQNTGRGIAKCCRVFLTSLDEVHPSGKTTPTVFRDAMQVAWAGREFGPRDVPRGVDLYIDLVHVSKHARGWEFGVHHLYANQTALVSYIGTYRFHLLATADNAEPSRFDIDISYNGDWHSVRAVAVPGPR